MGIDRLRQTLESAGENTVNAGPVILDSDVTLEDPDSPSFEHGYVLVTFYLVNRIQKFIPMFVKAPADAPLSPPGKLPANWADIFFRY